MSEPHSGKFGIVDGVHTVRNWTINDVVSMKRYMASNTKGGAGRARGIRSWNGSFTCYGGQPIHMPGSIFAFSGYTAPADDVLGSDGVVYGGNAIVDSIVLTWDWRNGELLSHVVNFNGHLALTISDDIKTDATFPDPETTIGTKIEMGEDVTFNEISNLATAALTITSENVSYVNSSTYISPDAWTGWKEGPKDWTLALTVDDSRRTGTGIPVLIERKEFRLYIDATTYYLLKWGKSESWAGTFDIESGALISGSINIGMDGHDGTSTGQIVLPDTTVFWP